MKNKASLFNVEYKKQKKKIIISAVDLSCDKESYSLTTTYLPLVIFLGIPWNPSTIFYAFAFIVGIFTHNLQHLKPRCSTTELLLLKDIYFWKKELAAMISAWKPKETAWAKLFGNTFKLQLNNWHIFSMLWRKICQKSFLWWWLFLGCLVTSLVMVSKGHHVTLLLIWINIVYSLDFLWSWFHW